MTPPKMSPIRKYLKNLQKKAPPKRGGILKKLGFQAQNNSIFIIIRPCTQASQAGIIGKPVRMAYLALVRIPLKRAHNSDGAIGTLQFQQHKKKGAPYRFFNVNGQLIFQPIHAPVIARKLF